MNGLIEMDEEVNRDVSDLVVPDFGIKYPNTRFWYLDI